MDITQVDTILGSIDYIAPEQIQSPRSVDQRADIYALGILLYVMLAGRHPSAAARQRGVSMLYAQLMLTPQPFAQCCPEVEIPEALEEVVLKALAKAPADRFQSVGALQAALGAFALCETTCHGLACSEL